MSKPRDYEELTRLISKMLDEELSMLEGVRLRQLLENDPAARRLYMQYIDTEIEFSCLVPGEAEEKKVISMTQVMQQPKGRTLRYTGIALAAAALLVVGVITGLALMQFMQPDYSVHEIAMKDFVGDVLIEGPDGPRPNENGPLRNGETLHTRGEASLASLDYADGTRITLWGNSSLTQVSGGHKEIKLTGSLSAEIAAQPVGERMIFDTGLALVEVLGTKIGLDAGAQRTELRVFEGEVRLVRQDDLAAKEVPAGHYAIVEKTTIESKPFPKPGDQWEWNPRKHGLEKNAQGVYDKKHSGIASRVDKDKDGKHVHTIKPAENWHAGLFTTHEDSFLNITYMIRKHAFFHLMMHTRMFDPLKPSQGIYFYDNPALWDKQRINQWSTVSVPLKDFERRSDKSQEAPIGDIAVGMAFSSVKTNPELLVQRVWVTRGKPPECQLLERR